MDTNKKNRTVFSISEEEESFSEVAPQIPPEAPPEPADQSPEPEEKIERGYSPQSQPSPEPTPVEEKEPESKGFLSSLFGGGKKSEEAEGKEEESAVVGTHITDIVQQDKPIEKTKSPGTGLGDILSLFFLFGIVALVIYSLLSLGPVKFLERLTTFPQWFPPAFEKWFETNVYPTLGPVVGNLEKELGP